MHPEQKLGTSNAFRNGVEVALYRELRLLERQGLVRLRTAAATLAVVAALVGAGGYWLGAGAGADPNSAPASGLSSLPSDERPSARLEARVTGHGPPMARASCVDPPGESPGLHRPCPGAD